MLAGGCYNDAPGPRSFRGGVWASADGGASWALRAEAPGWSARSGPRLVEVRSRAVCRDTLRAELDSWRNSNRSGVVLDAPHLALRVSAARVPASRG